MSISDEYENQYMIAFSRITIVIVEITYVNIDSKEKKRRRNINFQIVYNLLSTHVIILAYENIKYIIRK